MDKLKAMFFNLLRLGRFSNVSDMKLFWLINFVMTHNQIKISRFRILGFREKSNLGKKIRGNVC